MTTENPGLKIFNKWIKDNNQIYKFTKDSKYDDILPVMFKTISSEQQSAVLKSFIEKKLIRPDTISVLNKLTGRTRIDEYGWTQKEEMEKYEKEIKREERNKEIKDNQIIRNKIIHDESKFMEIRAKYGFFLDAFEREIGSYMQITRFITVKVFAGILNEKELDFKFKQIYTLLMIIKDHPRKFELLQALRPSFKYILQ